MRSTAAIAPNALLQAVRNAVRPAFFAAVCAAAGACTGNGHVEPAPFRASVGDTVVTCNCNLTFNHSSCVGGPCRNHMAVKLCLPPDLNAAIVNGGMSSSPAGEALSALSADQFAARVDAYCREAVTNIIYHTIQVFSSGWCDYKAPFAPQGGIGESVSCFAQAVPGEQMSATEKISGTCERPCSRNVCRYETNCGADVQDSFGNINLDRCQCNQVTEHFCPGDPPNALPTQVFCRP